MEPKTFWRKYSKLIFRYDEIETAFENLNSEMIYERCAIDDMAGNSYETLTERELAWCRRHEAKTSSGLVDDIVLRQL